MPERQPESSDITLDVLIISELYQASAHEAQKRQRWEASAGPVSTRHSPVHTVSRGRVRFPPVHRQTEWVLRPPLQCESQRGLIFQTRGFSLIFQTHGFSWIHWYIGLYIITYSSCICDSQTLETIEISLHAQWLNERTLFDVLTQMDVAQE